MGINYAVRMHLTKAQWGLRSRIDLLWVTMKLQCRSLSAEQMDCTFQLLRSHFPLHFAVDDTICVIFTGNIQVRSPDLIPSRIMDLSLCSPHTGRPVHILSCIKTEVGNLVTKKGSWEIISYVPETNKYYKVEKWFTRLLQVSSWRLSSCWYKPHHLSWPCGICM